MAIKSTKLSYEERIKFWSNHMKSLKKSKLTQAEYCRQNDLKPYMLSKWKITLLNKSDNNSFIEIPLNNLTKKSSNAELELIINDSIKIRLDENYNEELLLRILKTIGGNL